MLLYLLRQNQENRRQAASESGPEEIRVGHGMGMLPTERSAKGSGQRLEKAAMGNSACPTAFLPT